MGDEQRTLVIMELSIEGVWNDQGGWSDEQMRDKLTEEIVGVMQLIKRF